MGSDSSRFDNYYSQISNYYENYNNQIANCNINCTVHPNEGMKEYIYNLDVNISNSGPPEFIFIVDRSGSMGTSFNYIITKSIPEALTELGYEEKKIHLITFDSNINYFLLSKSELSKFNLHSGGNTYMSVSFSILRKILEISRQKCNHLRILVISDGMIGDQANTKQNGDSLYEDYKNVFKINSQCIRIGSNQVETQGMASILKLNNVKYCNLVEYKEEDLKDLSKVIVKLFKDDGLVGNQILIKGEKDAKLKLNPWEEKANNEQPIQNGRNTFFSDKNEPLFFNNSKISSINGEEVNASNYQNIIGKEKIANIFQKLKINKISNTSVSKNENKLITNYFKNLGEKIKKVDEYDDNNIINYLNEEINNINNDNNINNLNENQKANYITDLSNLNMFLEINMLKGENKKMKNKIKEILETNDELNKELNTLKERMGELEKKFEQFEKINEEKEKNEKKKNKIEISKNVVNELVFPDKNTFIEPVIVIDKSEKNEKEKNDENLVEIKNISNDSDDKKENNLNIDEVERK